MCILNCYYMYFMHINVSDRLALLFNKLIKSAVPNTVYVPPCMANTMKAITSSNTIIASDVATLMRMTMG